jgi:hypothetical protein
MNKGTSSSGHFVLPLIKMSGSAKSRANFTPLHLLAAKTAALTATNIENKYKSANPSQVDMDLLLSQVSISIICSVAALESNINEYLVDHEKNIDKIPTNFDPALFKKYKLTKNKLSKQLLENTNIIFKYDIIWFIKKNRLPAENKIQQDARYLTRLRNALTHFTPEWDNALSRHINLEKGVKNRFALNPFYPPKALFFPYRCLSASCAIWSCKVSNEFMELFKSVIR